MVSKLFNNQHSGIKIALTDPNRLFREGIINLLQAYDFIYSVKGFESGQKVIDNYLTSHFDIILVNCMLSDMSGAEVTDSNTKT